MRISEKGRSFILASPFSLFWYFIFLSLLFAFFPLSDASSYEASPFRRYHKVPGNGDCSHYDIVLFDIVHLSFHKVLPRCPFFHALILLQLLQPQYHHPHRLCCQKLYRLLRRPHLRPPWFPALPLW